MSECMGTCQNICRDFGQNKCQNIFPKMSDYHLYVRILAREHVRISARVFVRMHVIRIHVRILMSRLSEKRCQT